MLARMEPVDFDERFAADAANEREAAEARDRLMVILKKGFSAVCVCLGRELEPDAFEPVKRGKGARQPQQEAVASPNQAAAMMPMMIKPG